MAALSASGELRMAEIGDARDEVLSA